MSEPVCEQCERPIRLNETCDSSSPYAPMHDICKDRTRCEESTSYTVPPKAGDFARHMAEEHLSIATDTAQDMSWAVQHLVSGLRCARDAQERLECGRSRVQSIQAQCERLIEHLAQAAAATQIAEEGGEQR